MSDEDDGLKAREGLDKHKIGYWTRIKQAWRKTSLPNKLVVVFTAISAGATGVYAYYARQQFRIMRGQLEQMKGSTDQTNQLICLYEQQLVELHNATVKTGIAADAATQAANTARDTLKSSKTSFVIEQRPYIVVDEGSPTFIDHPSPDQPTLIDVTLRNVGRTPAIQVITEASTFSFRGKLLAKLTTDEERNKATEEYISMMESKFKVLRTDNGKVRKRINELRFRKLNPGQDVAPAKTYFLTGNPVIVSKDDFPLLTTGEIELFIVGIASYNDSYKSSYTTEFCYYYAGTDSKTWHICDSHNTNR
jgi:hypothetical protein